MTQYQPDEKNRIKRQKSDVAVRLAKEGRWEEAVQINRELLALFPDDSETLNRLGKAYLELKKFGEAKAAYEHAVNTDPSNAIAKKNLQRLVEYKAVPSALQPATAAGEVAPAPQPAPVAAPAARDKVMPSLFIEETGKTGTTSLFNVAPTAVLAKLTAGDAVVLEIDPRNQALLVKSQDGDLLGQVEPKLALRLVRFIEAGNRYTAAVTSVGERELKIIIREVYQHPSQRGRLSFPPKTSAAGYRAYTRDTVLRYGLEDDEEGLEDNDEEEEGESSEEEMENLSDEFVEENDQDDI
ncbi:MAG TPA: tetratricopeptide repeat protein [Chloroflexia bacterium]|nr:tetratricopeptide repeat protein [Chloroflexia bacterium]